MRRIRSKRQFSSSQDWTAEMTRAVAAFCIFLLLAPAATTAARVHGQKPPRRQSAAGRGVRRVGAWCAKQIAGCKVCLRERGTVAPNAEFPGETTAQQVEAQWIVRCLECQDSYVFNKDNENCDCAKGHGTAFPNGTLIAVDTFTQPTYNQGNFSDSMEFPEYSDNSTNSSNSSSKHSAADLATAVTNNFAESDNSSVNERAVVREMSLDRRRQPEQRRKFEQYMRAMGYNVRSSRQGTYLSDQRVQASFSSVDDRPKGQAKAKNDDGPMGEATAPESPLVCSACKGNAVSIGGLIGGSFCMPCEAGTTPDHNTGTCKSLS